jgi:hypothetical protein
MIFNQNGRAMAAPGNPRGIDIFALQHPRLVRIAAATGPGNNVPDFRADSIGMM